MDAYLTENFKEDIVNAAAGAYDHLLDDPEVLLHNYIPQKTRSAPKEKKLTKKLTTVWDRLFF